MKRERKPNLKAEAAYENAHLVAQDLDHGRRRRDWRSVGLELPMEVRITLPPSGWPTTVPVK